MGGEKRWWDDGISRHYAPTEGDFLLQSADSELRPAKPGLYALTVVGPAFMQLMDWPNNYSICCTVNPL